MGAPASPSDDRRFAWVPALVLGLSLAASFVLGVELAAVAGAVAGAALAWALARGRLARGVLLALLCPLSPAALWLHRVSARHIDVAARAAAVERRADALLFRADDARGAARAYAEALKIAPAFRLGHKLGLARFAVGDADGALRAFRSALAGDAGTPVVVSHPDSQAAASYREIGSRVAATVAKANFESASADRPKEIKEEDNKLKIVWADGTESSFPYEFLRNHCPCAHCVDEWTGKKKSLILLLPSNFRPMSIEPVGNYAIQFAWSDGHNSGIYSFRGLRELEKELAAAST